MNLADLTLVSPDLTGPLNSSILENGRASTGEPWRLQLGGISERLLMIEEHQTDKNGSSPQLAEEECVQTLKADLKPADASPSEGAEKASSPIERRALERWEWEGGS
jgi:hypothetical protein